MQTLTPPAPTMSRPAAAKRLPWQDRWTEPTLAQLLHPIEETRRKAVDNLIAAFEGFEGVERSIIWYGTSWKWTIEFTLALGGDEGEVMAYIVPSPMAPVICIPLEDAVISKLPIRRLNRYIRDGIRGSKCAVETHWALWTPSNGVEVEHLVDLFKRKHKLLKLGEAAAE